MDPSTTPALAPPPGVQPNFVNPPNQMPAVIIGSVCILTVLIIVVSLRMFTKIYVIQKIYIEDYLSILACASLMCYNGTIIYLASIGCSRHQWDVNLVMLPSILYWLNIVEILYAPTTALAKLSVLFQIKRIFTTKKRDIFFYAMWTSIVINGCFYLSAFWFYIFQCWPREAIWNATVQGTCIDSVAADFITGVGNVLSDLEALLLPAWAIWHLKTRLKTKLSIFAVFAVGCVALGIGAVGIWYRVLLLTDTDFTWVCTQVAMLAVAEISIVIIVGCMPVSPRLFKWCKPKIQGIFSIQNDGTGASRSHKLASSAFKRDRDRSSAHRAPDLEILVTRAHQFTRCSSNEDLELQAYPEPVHHG